MCGVALFAWIFILTINPFIVKSNMKQYYAVKTTIAEMRKNNESIENAAMQLKIAEVNQWLAEQQYWNTTLLDDAIPDEIDSLEYLK